MCRDYFYVSLNLVAVPAVKVNYDKIRDTALSILGDPGADSGGEGKSKQAEKYGTKEK